MIGSKILTIDGTQFLQGMSSSDNTADGGFSNRSINVNLLAEPGVLNATAEFTNNLSSSVAGTIIATAGDANSLGNRRYVVTTTDVAGGNGKYYTIASDYTTTLRQTDSTNTYIPENSDTCQFQLALYTTTETDITYTTGGDLASQKVDWWTGAGPTGQAQSVLNSGNRHPMIVYENALWIGDKNKLHKWDGTTPSNAFLLLSTEQSITALGIDPGTGKMLISVTEGTNAANTHSKMAKILTYDGFSPKPTRAVIVDDTVNAIYPVGGTVYMTYGQRLGYWTGSGISFLRKLKNVTLAATDLVYKERITNIGNTLYVVDGSVILAYGEVKYGRKVFYYPLQNNFSADVFTAIFNIGSNQLAMSYSTAKLYTYDVTSTSTINSAGVVFYSNQIEFPQPAIIRTVYLEYSDNIAAAATPATISLIDENGTATSLEALTNGASGNIRRLTVHGPDKKVMSTQVLYTGSTIVAGLKRIIIRYDTVEN